MGLVKIIPKILLGTRPLYWKILQIELPSSISR